MTDTEFQIRVSYNYHKKRESFFRLLDASGKFVSVLALTTLVAVTNAASVFFAVFSAIVTITSVIIDFSGAASKHDTLAIAYLTLLSKYIAGDISEVEAGTCCREIGAREPTALRGLAQLCQDEEEARCGNHVPLSRFSLRRRIAAHLGRGEREIDWVS